MDGVGGEVLLWYCDGLVWYGLTEWVCGELIGLCRFDGLCCWYGWWWADVLVDDSDADWNYDSWMRWAGVVG